MPSNDNPLAAHEGFVYTTNVCFIVILYDSLLTIDQEITYIWKERNNPSKWLYIHTKYLIVVLEAIGMSLALSDYCSLENFLNPTRTFSDSPPSSIPAFSPHTLRSKMLFQLYIVLPVVSLIPVQVISMFRVHALNGSSRTLKWSLFTLFFVIWILGFLSFFLTGSGLALQTGNQNSCYDLLGSRSSVLFYFYASDATLQLVLLILCLKPMWRDFIRSASVSELHRIVLIETFVFLFVMSVSKVTWALSLETGISGVVLNMIVEPKEVIVSVVTTRFLLRLRAFSRQEVDTQRISSVRFN